uniref:Corticotropin-releasing factor-binding protein n=1 Tax=Tetraodon nigroviridis TaxID=99883 RepID=H3D7I4_TETNG
MERTFREQLFVLLLSLSVLKGDCRYIENNEISKDELYSFFNAELKRETPEELMFRRPLRCLDMIAVEGQFSFAPEHPQLSCAAFLLAEPNQVISVDYDSVDIDCSGGDFITVFDGWVMKGEKFPSPQDHPLPLYERYVDYCDSGSLRGSVRSSQNVAMVFFRIHNPGSSFTLTVRKHVNPFPCNVISQSPEGAYTMVIPQQHRNCSFSIIYPVEINVSEFSLGQFNHFPKRSRPVCAETGDFVQLLGGNGIDTSKLLPITDLCVSFTGPTHLKVGCDNTVVRMVSSGKFVSRVSFSYRLLDRQELQTIKLNNVEDFCFNN